MYSQIFFIATERDASGDPRNSARAGETVCTFSMPAARAGAWGFAGAGVAAAADDFAAAIRARHLLAKTHVDDAMICSVFFLLERATCSPLNPRERENG